MKRRVLFLAPVNHFKGGAEISLFDLLRNPLVDPVLAVPEEGSIAEMARQEGVPVLVTPFGKVNEIKRPFRFWSVFTAAGDWLAAARAVARASREIAAVAIHSNGLKAHGVAMLARLFGGAPVVAHVRDIPLTRSEFFVWRLFAACSYKMILVSRPCWPFSGDLPRCVEVVHNGVEIHERCGRILDRGRPIILGFCGRLHPFKGINVLLDWMSAAVAQGVPVRLVIRGEAAPADKAWLQSVLDRIAHEFTEGVILLEGKMTSIEDIYRGIDVVVVPSNVPDPLPRSAMEAMSLGLPVIGWPAGGIPDLVREGETGWLVDNSHRFVVVVNSLIADPEIYKNISTTCLRVAREEFSLSRLHASMGKIYQNL
ncbi:glycosyltransferase family 4 protein [Rhodoplanes sp. SY1]|uniref:glycosyltransferase family 4 protein n=1 Tax=Rhodoplanes sp. SY1 TaxID=3166646 RepID=UPI0038B58B6D